MAELNANGIDAGLMVSVAKYATDYLGVTVQAVDYAIGKGLIDWVVMDSVRFVVLTEATRTYVPNISKKRARMQT